MANAPTKAQRAKWEIIRALGCCVCESYQAEIHHCYTGMGGRKNHDAVIPLCTRHHRGDRGIHTIGRKTWRAEYGTEQELIERTNAMLRRRNAA